LFTSKYKDNSEKSTGLLFMRVYNKWHFTIKQAFEKAKNFANLAKISAKRKSNVKFCEADHGLSLHKSILSGASC